HAVSTCVSHPPDQRGALLILPDVPGRRRGALFEECADQCIQRVRCVLFDRPFEIGEAELEIVLDDVAPCAFEVPDQIQRRLLAERPGKDDANVVAAETRWLRDCLKVCLDELAMFCRQKRAPGSGQQIRFGGWDAPWLSAADGGQTVKRCPPLVFLSNGLPQ